MPEKIILEDGSEREVPTAEELQALQQKAQKAAEAEAKLQEIEGDKNWKAVRPQVEFAKNVRKTLEAKGIKVDDEGNIIETAAAPISAEEIERRATEAARKTATEFHFSQEKERSFSNLDSDTRSVAEKFYSKLSQGETLTLEKHKEILDLAVSAAQPRRNSGSTFVDGAPPRFKSDSAPSQSALEMGSAFGLSEEDFKKDGSVRV